MTDSIRARARAIGIAPSTLWRRQKAGWIEADLLTPTLPPTHTYKKATKAKPSHPWKRWEPGRFSRRDAEARRK